jgi:hypothetical protein
MPVNIGAPTVSSGSGTGVAESLEAWASQKRQERINKNLVQAREEGQTQEIEQDEQGNRKLPEQRKAFMGILGSKTVDQYNKGLRDAYVTSIDRDNTEEINRISQEADGDVDKYNKSIDEYRKKVLASVDPVARDIVGKSLESMSSRGFTQVQRVSIARSNQASKDERLSSFATYADEASRLTRNGEFEGAQENLLKSRATLDSMVESGDISAAEADEMFIKSKKGVFRQGYKKEVLDIAENDTDAAFKKISELEKEIPKDYTPDEWENVISDMRSDVARLQTRVAGGARQSLKLAKSRLKDMEQSLSVGFTIDSQDKADVYDLVKGTDLESDYKRLLNLETFAVQTRANRTAILSMAQNQANTLEGQQDYIALKKANDRINKMAEDDGYSLGVRQGLIEHIPFDPQNPESFAERLEQADTLSGIYGVEVGPLMDSEVEGIVNLLPESTPEDKVNLALTLGPSQAIWKQLDKKNANVFAMAGAIGDRNVMTAIFKGQELIKTKQVKLPSQEEYLTAAEDVIGLAGEVYGVEDRKAVIESAIAYHASTTDSPEIFRSGDFEDALEAVTGGIAKVNGFKLELPRGVDEDDFEDFVDDLQPEIIEEMGGLMHMKPEDAQDAQWQSIGDGRYYLLNNGLIQLNKKGEPFVIEYNEDLAERNKLLAGQKSKRRGR